MGRVPSTPADPQPDRPQARLTRPQPDPIAATRDSPGRWSTGATCADAAVQPRGVGPATILRRLRPRRKHLVPRLPRVRVRSRPAPSRSLPRRAASGRRCRAVRGLRAQRYPRRQGTGPARTRPAAGRNVGRRDRRAHNRSEGQAELGRPVVVGPGAGQSHGGAGARARPRGRLDAADGPLAARRGHRGLPQASAASCFWRLGLGGTRCWSAGAKSQRRLCPGGLQGATASHDRDHRGRHRDDRCDPGRGQRLPVERSRSLPLAVARRRRRGDAAAPSLVTSAIPPILWPNWGEATSVSITHRESADAERWCCLPVAERPGVGPESPRPGHRGTPPQSPIPPVASI